MKATHLKTLSARIDEIELSFNDTCDSPTGDDYITVLNYNDFLKNPLTLSMFVPCGKDGKPLEKPKEPRYSVHAELSADENAIYSDLLVDYHDDLIEAQQNVIFEGWEVLSGKVIEHKETGNRIAYYSNGNVYFDKREKEGYLNYLVGTNPTLSDLAAATIENPLKLKQ